MHVGMNAPASGDHSKDTMRAGLGGMATRKERGGPRSVTSDLVKQISEPARLATKFCMSICRACNASTRTTIYLQPSHVSPFTSSLLLDEAHLNIQAPNNNIPIGIPLQKWGEIAEPPHIYGWHKGLG